MKTIEIDEVYYSVQSFYQKANSKNLRALLGFIIKSGQTQSPIYGGAFDLIREIENAQASSEIYGLMPTSKASIKIVSIAEKAMKGRYDEWAMTEREIKIILDINHNERKWRRR